MTHSLMSLNKLCNHKVSQINIFTNKPDNSGQHNHTMSFFTHFDFESVLSSKTHSWWANIYYSLAEALSIFATHSFYLISTGFFLLHDKHFETNENISNRIDESNTPSFYNTIHRLVWWVGWINFLFSSLFFRENCIWSSCFLFITVWLSLDTSSETASWITLVCSLVCWD